MMSNLDSIEIPEEIKQWTGKLVELWMTVALEVAVAREKFPTWPTDPLHAAAVVAEETGELHKATLEHTYEPDKSSREDVRKEAIQTAAMALRFLMSMDDYEFTPGPQHSQG